MQVMILLCMHPIHVPNVTRTIYTHHSAKMSNRRVNDNVSHIDSATETADVLMDANRFNGTNNIDVPDGTCILLVDHGNNPQNEEIQATQHVADWSFLNGNGKKRKYGFKVRFVLYCVCYDHETLNGYLTKSWVRITTEQDKSTVNRDARGNPTAFARHASAPTKKSRLEVVFRVAFHISFFSCTHSVTHLIRLLGLV